MSKTNQFVHCAHEYASSPHAKTETIILSPVSCKIHMQAPSLCSFLISEIPSKGFILAMNTSYWERSTLQLVMLTDFCIIIKGLWHQEFLILIISYLRCGGNLYHDFWFSGRTLLVQNSNPGVLFFFRDLKFCNYRFRWGASIMVWDSFLKLMAPSLQRHSPPFNQETF